MRDVVLDTCVLGPFLVQYFQHDAANRGSGRFHASGLLTGALAERLNRIARQYSLSAVVVASAFAFVELARKWDAILADSIREDQLDAFIRQPPTWFDIAPVDSDLMPYFLQVPCEVNVGGSLQRIEWTDAIHAAVALSRGHDCLLATTDRRLQNIPVLEERLVL